MSFAFYVTGDIYMCTFIYTHTYTQSHVIVTVTMECLYYDFHFTDEKYDS